MRDIILSVPEREQLEQMVKLDPKAYRRERAAALLKIAAGQAGARVAREGLLRRRKPDTVYAWCDRFIEAGVAGLTIRPGRGRKVTSPPLASGPPGAGRDVGRDRPPRAPAVRSSAESLDAGGDPTRVPLAGGLHAVGGLAAAGAAAGALEAGARLHP